MGEKPLLVEMQGISKCFPGVQALESVNFTLLPGEVHVLLGENGAGKSTLMKILTGVYPPDAGEIYLEGKRIRPASVREAQALGLVMVMQEFNLIPELSVAENILLLPRPGRLLGRVNRRRLEADAELILARLGIPLRPGELVRRLSVAGRQMTEIAKAMSLKARVLVLDEPTASLSPGETEKLFALMRGLKAEGVGLVYISHRFEEIYAVGDRVTVLRDGRRISTTALNCISRDELLRQMAGREIADLYPRRRRAPGPPVLEVSHLRSGERVKDVSLVLHEGEILGLAGLVGAGRTETVKAIFGAAGVSGGEIKLFGQQVRLSSPAVAMERGMAYCTEDRKEEGLFLDHSLAFNISLTDLRSVMQIGIISRSQERRLARNFIHRLRLRPAEPDRLTRTLSGGSQQKVMLAKALHTRPRILIMDEPTRGIDVTAKVEVYSLLDQFVAEGGAVILVSSDLPEVLALSDRILVMYQGRIAGECHYPDFSPEKILALATGLKSEEVPHHTAL